MDKELMKFAPGKVVQLINWQNDLVALTETGDIYILKNKVWVEIVTPQSAFCAHLTKLKEESGVSTPDSSLNDSLTHKY